MIEKIKNHLWAIVWYRWMTTASGHRRTVVKVKGWRTAIVDSKVERRQTITPCFKFFGVDFD